MEATLTVFPPPSTRRGHRPRLLAIDDEPSLQRLLEFNLGRAGYDVKAVTSGEEALASLAQGLPDIVLLDLMLPGIDGLETLRAIRQCSADLPVILLTAHGTIDHAVEAMKIGAQDFLTKPFELERLSLALRNALEMSQLRGRIETLRSRLDSSDRFGGIVGVDGGLRETVLLLEKVIPTDLTVLIEGESGTGKELIARAIHDEGPRSEGPFLAINCAALPEALLESELFGHEKGAFTGADRCRPGKFELADGGTILLDEIGEISPTVQSKLLRTLQERTVTRLGSPDPRPVDVRILCSTNRDLRALVDAGRFRDDLYYRIAVFPLTVPPLRARRCDVPDLVRHVLDLASPQRRIEVHPGALTLLEGYDWPGNVRELQNVLRRALVLASGEQIRPEHLPANVHAAFGNSPAPLDTAVAARPYRAAVDDENLQIAPLAEIEREHIVRAVEACRGNLSRAARLLGIGRTTLYRKLDRYGLAP